MLCWVYQDLKRDKKDTLVCHYHIYHYHVFAIRSVLKVNVSIRSDLLGP